MKPDFYTKAVLTVIAALLAWQCFLTTMPTVSAQGGPQRVVIVGIERPLRGLPVTLVDQSGAPLDNGGILRVALPSYAQAIPVAITTILKPNDPRVPWDAIRVDVPKAPNAKVPGD